jgi:hypothetical protein
MLGTDAGTRNHLIASLIWNGCSDKYKSYENLLYPFGNFQNKDMRKYHPCGCFQEKRI